MKAVDWHAIAGAEQTLSHAFVPCCLCTVAAAFLQSSIRL